MKPKIHKLYRNNIWPFVLVVSYGGFWFPKAGLVLFPMLITIMLIGIFRNRYWCGKLCPRGAFLDRLKSLVFFPANPLPKIFKSEKFKIGFLVILMSFFIRNTILALMSIGEIGFWDRLGLAGVLMCALTTTIALGFALFYQPRAWCTVCPMGTVQTKLYQFRALRTE